MASRPKEAAQGDPKPGQRKRVTKARPKRYVPAVTQGKVGAQTAIETVETPVSPTPPKRRKKRKPIGQGGRRKDQPAAAAEVQQPLLVMVGSIATRDELFKAPSQSHKLDMTFHGKKGTPVKKSFKELQEVDVKEPRPMIEDNQKGAKDRKLVARNPRPRVVTTEHGKIEPPGSSSISTGSVQDKMWESPRAAAVQHIDQPRKPLADVTNNTSGPKVKRAALRSPEHKTSAQGPPKSRDLPPNEPNQDPFYMDALVETFSALPEYKTKVSKPKLTKIKPQSEPQPMLKEMAKGAVNHSEQDQASAPKRNEADHARILHQQSSQLPAPLNRSQGKLSPYVTHAKRP